MAVLGVHSRRRSIAVAALTACAMLAAAGVAEAAPKKTAISVLDYSQCANGAPPATDTTCVGGWINGVLQSSNSHYREDEVTPQRAVFSVPAGSQSTGRTLTFSYQARKGSAQSHAYDSLTTWNTTVTGADRCQGIASICPGGPESTFPVPPDPTPVLPVGPGIDPATSAHQLAGAFTMYGGTITNIAYATPSHTAPSSPSSDDYATIVVTYNVNTSVTRNVQVLFGGHLAASIGPRGWGAGLGSSNISGGPYHIKWTAADGASVGNRDNQIMGASILEGRSDLVVTKTATPNPANVGQTVNYTITITNSGTASGTTDVTDTYDVTHLNVNNASVSDGGMDNDAGTITWTGITVAAGSSKNLTYSATVVGTFSGGGGTGGCPPGQHPVPNTATISAGGSSTHVLCVPASPNLTVSKTATPNPAAIGATVSYKITITNSGAASGTTNVTDNYDVAHLNVSNASVSDGGMDNDAGTITWTGITVAANSSKDLTYSATVVGTFSGGGGTGGCNPGQHPVPNTVTLSLGGASTTHTLCVPGVPNLTLAKQADATSVDEGGTITYTITYGNTGSGGSPNTTITETVPAGASFVSCSGGNDPGGCTVSGNTVTYAVGTVSPGGGGSVTLTIRVNTANAPACIVCNIATISSQSGGTVQSNQVCVTVRPVAHPEDANANDSALGAKVYAELGPLPTIDQEFAHVSTTQSGVGSVADDDQVANVMVPPADGSVLSADIIRSTSVSTVAGAPQNQASHTSVAETLNVNVLDGTVTASVARAVASVTASGDNATYSAAGSVLEELMVDADGPGGNPPVAIEDVQPGMQIDLAPGVFGPGSLVMVMLNERSGSTTTPAPGQTSGGTYAADLTVTMIHLYASDYLGLGPVDVVVSRAIAHADFPQTTVCGNLDRQKVSGHAFVLSEQADPNLLPVLWGLSDIPMSGGHESQSLTKVDALPVLYARTAATDSAGTVGAGSSTASSFAEAAGVCVLDSGGCTISARALRSQSNSNANAGGAASDDTGTEFLGLEVAGQKFGAQPGVNTVINLDGFGFVILNEQFCDGGGGPPCGGSSASGQTVRAIRIVITVPNNPLGLTAGAEIIVAEAHSDATFQGA